MAAPTPPKPYQVIARKYRPRAFEELIGQEHVSTTLKNAIVQRRIAHGYIFSGQRGTGKTTVARIIARCLNCEQGPTIKPCGVCASCSEISAGSAIDIIEIDAASNRGINEMRELRESVRFRPARDRYKIFIIDEAHQITNEAFNALLKTLEEPPEWVVFMLCTTESHKIPNTIASRCQQFSFRSVEFDTVLARLKWICEQEGVEADAEALSVLALAGEGSVRDSLSALDQAIACCGNTLNAADVRQLLGRFSIQTLEEVAQALAALDARRMLEIIQQLESTGQNLQHFSRELCRFFRNLLVAKVAGPDSRLIAATTAERERLTNLITEFSEEDLTRYLHLTLDLFQSLQYSLQPRMHLELGLVKLVHAGRLRPIEEIVAQLQSGVSLNASVQPKSQTARFTAPTPQPPPAAAPAAISKPAPEPKPALPAAVTVTAPSNSAAGPASVSTWRDRLLELLNDKGMTFIADAVEHSDIRERSAGELEFVTGKEFAMAVRSSDMLKTVEALAKRPMKIKVSFGEVAPQPIASSEDRRLKEDEAARLALENPEVQRYRDLFPGSEVRAVRNLKE